MFFALTKRIETVVAELEIEECFEFIGLARDLLGRDINAFGPPNTLFVSKDMLYNDQWIWHEFMHVRDEHTLAFGFIKSEFDKIFEDKPFGIAFNEVWNVFIDTRLEGEGKGPGRQERRRLFVGTFENHPDVDSLFNAMWERPCQKFPEIKDQARKLKNCIPDKITIASTE